MKYTFADDKQRNTNTAIFLKRWLGLESLGYNLPTVFDALHKDESLAPEFHTFAVTVHKRLAENYHPDWYTPPESIRNHSGKKEDDDYDVPTSVILFDALKESELFTPYVLQVIQYGDYRGGLQQLLALFGFEQQFYPLLGTSIEKSVTVP